MDERTFVTHPEFETLVLNRPPINVYGYTVFPDDEERNTWLSQDEQWPESWLPLSSNYHPVIFYFDSELSKVMMLPGFRETDDSGRYNNGVPVYDDIQAFIQVVECNADILNQPNAFDLPDENAYEERLSTKAADKVAHEMREINGPVILPFFFGTLGEHDHLADPAQYANQSW